MCPDGLSGEAAAAVYPERLVGSWRRFGAVGPVYQVVGAGAPTRDGDRLMRVRVPESGEETDYRLSQLTADPLEG